MTAEKPETPQGMGCTRWKQGARGPFFPLHQHGGIGCDKSAVRTYDAKIKKRKNRFALSLLHAYIEDYHCLNGPLWRM
jgi:hypothetical protein